MADEAGPSPGASGAGLYVREREPLEDGPAGGALVLLIHGSMDRASSFTRLMRRLPDWTVVTYDRRGYAGSRHVPTSENLGRQVDDVLEVLAGRRAVGVGHSFGGTLLLAAAERRPELLDTLVVYEPPQPWQRDWPSDTAGQQARRADHDPEAAAEAFMRRTIGDELWQRLPEATRQQRRSEGVALRADMTALAGAPAFDPSRIEVPVIAARGEHGRPHQRRGVEVLAAALPDAELVDVPEADHGIHLARPEALADLARLALTRRQRRRLGA